MYEFIHNTFIKYYNHIYWKKLILFQYKFIHLFFLYFLIYFIHSYKLYKFLINFFLIAFFYKKKTLNWKLLFVHHTYTQFQLFIFDKTIGFAQSPQNGQNYFHFLKLGEINEIYIMYVYTNSVFINSHA